VELEYIRILEGTTSMAWRSKRKVMHAYDITAEIYDERYREEQHRKYRKALEVVDVLDAAILDAGCGSGLFFSEVADRVKVVVGVDVSKKLLLKAKANAVNNVFLVQADADHLPFRDHIFDAAFSFTVLQNMPKPSQTLEEIGRVIVRGGEMVITGLKKAFPQTSFHDLVESSGLTTGAFRDEEDINCYIAVLST
jgi:ubiquinone/menaquinone biosynthesis C-methylase UbiE